MPLVTVTSTEPVPAGETAVMEVAEFTVTRRLAWRRTRRLSPGEAGAGDGDRVPPAAGPKSGLMAVTVGASKAKRSAGLVAEVPLPLVTVTSTEPVPAGETAVMEVAEFTVTEAAGVAPNETVGSPVKPVPVMVTEVPPAAGPKSGLMAVTVGASKAKRSAGLVAEVPLPLVTVTSTVPDPAGAVAVSWVDERTTTDVPGVVPNLTVEPGTKLVPVTVTDVPLPPWSGAIDVTVGDP